jgi:Skp family chaperone for outer membrane proteins
MRSTPSVVALSLALVAGAGFLSVTRGNGSADAAPAAGQIAVVDIVDLISSAPGKRTVEASNKKRQEAFQAWDAEQQRKLKELASTYDLLPKADVDRRLTATHDLAVAKATYDAERNFQMLKAENEMGNELEALYAEVKSAATRVAKQNGYLAVFTKTSEPLRISSSKISAEFDAQVAARPLLYWDPNLDITEMVKAEMLRAAPPAPATPAPGTTPRPGVPPPPPSGPGTPGMGGN